MASRKRQPFKSLGKLIPPFRWRDVPSTDASPPAPVSASSPASSKIGPTHAMEDTLLIREPNVPSSAVPEVLDGRVPSAATAVTKDCSIPGSAHALGSQQPSPNRELTLAEETSSPSCPITRLTAVDPRTKKITAIHSTLPGTAHASGTKPFNLPPPVLSRNRAFDRAVEVVQQKHFNLSDDDRAAFQSASDVDVMEELRRAQHGASRISDSLTRAQKVLESVNRLMGPLAIFIQHSPEISSLVVGGLKCILMVCIILLTVNHYLC